MTNKKKFEGWSHFFFNLKVGVIIHELMHAIGFVHEQTRPDRDDWVEIVWENIVEGDEDQFQKFPTGYVQTLGTDYDYASVMHYGPYDFSKHPKRFNLKKKQFS